MTERENLPDEPAVEAELAADAVTDAVEPVESADAVEPVEPADAVADVEPSEPTEPTDTAEPARTPGRGRAAAVTSLRIARGLVGLGVAAAVVAATGLLAAPALQIAPLATTVEPEPASLLRSCPGPAHRLGDASGARAGDAFAVGVPTTTVVAVGGTAAETPLTSDTGASPLALHLAPAPGAALAGTQAQYLDGGDDLAGLAVASCTESASSSWLVGGAMTVGRTTLLVLTNPTEVAADVTVSMWGENGAITAPGMAGIRVAAGAQRIIPLAGFAPDVVSPVVHVEARGGQVSATLQSSVIRVLTPGGIDLIGAGAAPARTLVVPAVRIADAMGVGSALGAFDHQDLESIARIANPGDTDASVEVSVQPASAGGSGTSFVIQIAAGRVVDIPLTAGLALGEGLLPDGSYSVTFTSTEPVIAGVRAATTPTVAADAGIMGGVGPVDLAWFTAAPALRGDVLAVTADAEAPVLVATNLGPTERVVTLEPSAGGAPIELRIPALSAASVALDPARGYLVRGAEELRIGISYAAEGQLAGHVLRSDRQADTALVVRP